jgi:hypothetical protein
MNVRERLAADDSRFPHPALARLHKPCTYAHAARPPTRMGPARAHGPSMLIEDYVRTSGRRLTYRIEADDFGFFTVFLDGKELLRGQDPLCAHGRHRVPNKRKAAGAVHQAKIAIESLSQMAEV